MTQIIRANQRYSKNAGWLQANWLFSFSDYYDPESNINIKANSNSDFILIDVNG